MLKTEQILSAKFTPVSKGTYNAEEVDSFLKIVAESYEESINQNKELMKKISFLADKIETYRNDEEAIKLALLDAHRMADSINKEATEKADAKVKDAESRSKLILDGANRQSAQMIDESREKAKEIVDNARTAVASLTERAQIETENAITAAQNKAAEIVAAAKAKGEEIIGDSKESYAYYSAELAKVKAETAKFKETIQNLCKGQLNLLDGIPEGFAAAVAAVVEEAPVAAEPVAAVVEEEPEEEIEAAPEVNVVPEAEEVLAEIENEVQVAYVPEAVEETAEEAEESVIIEEIEETAEEVEEEPEAEVIEAVEEDEDDDLFGFIDEIDFDEGSIPSSLDDLIPELPAIEPEAVAEESAAVEEAEEEFAGFKVDLDSIEGMSALDELEEDDDDITSLFDSMFDD